MTLCNVVITNPDASTDRCTRVGVFPPHMTDWCRRPRPCPSQRAQAASATELPAEMTNAYDLRMDLVVGKVRWELRRVAV